MKIINIKRSNSVNAVHITYENGNTGSIFSTIGFGADLTTPELVKLFEDPAYDTNGFNTKAYTEVARRWEGQATDWVTEYEA